jgi:hypothetical protein
MRFNFNRWPMMNEDCTTVDPSETSSQSMPRGNVERENLGSLDSFDLVDFSNLPVFLFRILHLPN